MVSEAQTNPLGNVFGKDVDPESLQLPPAVEQQEQQEQHRTPAKKHSIPASEVSPTKKPALIGKTAKIVPLITSPPQ